MRPGRAADHSPPSSAVVMEEVELYLYPPSGPHRTCNGITLTFTNCNIFVFMTVYIYIYIYIDTHTHTTALYYVIPIAFPQQQWLCECALMLRSYARYVSCFNFR